jgi:hypothetical protein
MRRTGEAAIQRGGSEILPSGNGLHRMRQPPPDTILAETRTGGIAESHVKARDRHACRCCRISRTAEGIGPVIHATDHHRNTRVDFRPRRDTERFAPLRGAPATQGAGRLPDYGRMRGGEVRTTQNACVIAQRIEIDECHPAGGNQMVARPGGDDCSDGFRADRLTKTLPQKRKLEWRGKCEGDCRCSVPVRREVEGRADIDCTCSLQGNRRGFPCSRRSHVVARDQCRGARVLARSADGMCGSARDLPVSVKSDFPSMPSMRQRLAVRLQRRQPSQSF